MDKRMTRLWAAAEARALGFGDGAIVLVAQQTPATVDPHPWFRVRSGRQAG